MAGSIDDVSPIHTSSKSGLLLSTMGDTLRIAQSKVPTEEGYAGEVTWTLAPSGTGTIFLCVTSAVLDEDGEVITPAVWMYSNLNPTARPR